MMNNHTLTYYALIDEEKSPGVAKKIDQTVNAANKIGIKSKKNLFKNTLKGIKEAISNLKNDESEIIIVRFSDLAFPFLFPLLVLKRIKGKKIIVDIPTPRKTAIKEIETLKISRLKKGLRKSINYLSGSWILLPANLIVQYSSEGRWFELGISKKTIKIGNGITIDDSTPLSKSTWPSQTLNLIAVAQLADWHGYDRILRALSVATQKNLSYAINLTIVGDGEPLQKLQELSKELKLSNVRFTGRLTGADLDREFEGKHLGIASLGLYRIGLHEASVLKTREYIARGLCVIGTGRDPDFDENSPYRFLASNEDEIESLVKILCSFEKEKIPTPEEARAYADSKLTMTSKIDKIIKSI